jgi:hypothetical protein
MPSGEDTYYSHRNRNPKAFPKGFRDPAFGLDRHRIATRGARHALTSLPEAHITAISFRTASLAAPITEASFPN